MARRVHRLLARPPRVGGLTALFILAAPVLMPPLDRRLRRPRRRLSHILFPIVVLLGLFGIVMGILNSYEQFTVPALTPVLWNLAIIAGLVLGVPRADTDSAELYVYAGSIVVGTLIQFLLPLPWLRGLDGRLRLALDCRDPAVKRVFMLMLPVTLALGLINVNAVIGTVFASQLIDPSRAGRDRQRVPPLHAAAGDVLRRGRHGALPVARAARRPRRPRRLPRTSRTGLRQINFLLVPAAVVSRRARRADRAPALRARRVRPRPDAASSPARSRPSRSGSRSTG